MVCYRKKLLKVQSLDHNNNRLLPSRDPHYRGTQRSRVRRRTALDGQALSLQYAQHAYHAWAQLNHARAHLFRARARGRFSWARARYGTHVVGALTALERGTSDTCSMIEWTFLSGKSDRSVQQYIVRGPCIISSQTTQNNKPQSFSFFSSVFTSYRKIAISHLWSRDYEHVAFFSVKNNSEQKQWLLNVDA